MHISSSDGSRLGSRVFRIVEHLYNAASRPDAWTHTCAVLAAHFGGTSAALFLEHNAGVVPVAFPGFSDAAPRLYEQHFNKVDPWALAARKVSSAERQTYFALGHHIVPQAVYEASEFWYDFCRVHVGAFHLMGSSFGVGDGTYAMLGLHRPRDSTEFEPADLQQLRLLQPHLRNALYLAHRIQGAERLAELGFAALEQLALGIAIVDPAREIVFANAELERLVSSGVFLLRPDAGAAPLRRKAKLSMARHADQARLASLVENAARNGAGGAMHAHAIQGERRLALRVMPLPRRLSPRSSTDGALDSGRVLVIVRDDANPVAISGSMLKALYGLTEAEVAVSRALLGGRTPEAVAAERRVSLPTIRTQIRHVFEKTGVRSLRELDSVLRAS